MMILFENYNTAKQKFGDEIVNELTRMGLPPNYPCRCDSSRR